MTKGADYDFEVEYADASSKVTADAKCKFETAAISPDVCRSRSGGRARSPKVALASCLLKFTAVESAGGHWKVAVRINFAGLCDIQYTR